MPAVLGAGTVRLRLELRTGRCLVGTDSQLFGLQSQDAAVRFALRGSIAPQTRRRLFFAMGMRFRSRVVDHDAGSNPLGGGARILTSAMRRGPGRNMETHSATELVAAADPSPDDFLGLDAGEPAYTIGDVVRQFGLTHRALRFYESRGLVKPARRGSTRLYGRTHLERLAVIVKAKKLGLTLSAIGQLLGDERSEQTLRLSRETCEAQIAVLERKLAETQEALAELRAIRRFV
jgi:DNA-binding transcriptional MerR regulator